MLSTFCINSTKSGLSTGSPKLPNKLTRVEEPRIKKRILKIMSPKKTRSKYF